VYLSDKDAGKSGADLYFIEEDGSTFKATVLFQPYFFVICKVGSSLINFKPNTEGDVEDYLRRRFESTISNITRVEMEDLSLVNDE
jgi:DNA polymerase epsilon subunit 1